MFYSDKETEESEKKFQEDLQRVRKYAAEKQEEQGAILFALIDEGNKLMKKKKPSPEVVARLNEIMEQIEEISKVFNENLLILEESLTRSSNYIFHEIKKKAEEGSPEAMKAYLDLKPDYEGIMLSKASTN